MKKGKRTKRVMNGEIRLPEAMIQHIQSFMSRKEAARTTIISKSWYKAWLTRPVLDFDTTDFHLSRPEAHLVFKEFVKKTMQRYQDLSLKIDSFKLFSYGSHHCWGEDWSAFNYNLIVGAMKMGATTVQLECCKFVLPQEVLGSETLLKLSLIWCELDENCTISCSRLRSLTLQFVNIKRGDLFKGLISCCILMEELSIYCCNDLPVNQFELHKLRRLVLFSMGVGSIFFTNFSSRFPSLKDLSIFECYDCPNIHVASTSLETICFRARRECVRAKFGVPNIRKFTYSCFGLPSCLSIDGPSREWEFDISVESYRFHKTSWFPNLNKLLKKFRLSRISLCIDLNFTNQHRRIDSVLEFDVEVVKEPLVVENLTIDAPPACRRPLLARSLGVFRPKFITHPRGLCYAWILDEVKSVRVFRWRLLQLFISDWYVYRREVGLKEVNVEIYDKCDREWRPPQLEKAKADSEAEVRLPLIWED